MSETVDLAVHLTTNVATGELEIAFDPTEHGGLGVIPTSDWPDIRAGLRGLVRDRVDSPDEFQAYLDSNRTGERLDVQIGEISVAEDGEVVSEAFSVTSVDDVNW